MKKIIIVLVLIMVSVSVIAFDIKEIELYSNHVDMRAKNVHLVKDKVCTETRVFDNGHFDYSMPEWINDFDDSKYGCNRLPNAQWTGTKCCGDLTEAGNGKDFDDSSGTVTGESYVDTLGACLYSTPIMHNERLIDRTQYDGNYKGINPKQVLFYNDYYDDNGYVVGSQFNQPSSGNEGIIYVCAGDNGDTTYTTLSGLNDVNSHLGIKNPGDTVGDFVCVGYDGKKDFIEEHKNNLSTCFDPSGNINENCLKCIGNNGNYDNQCKNNEFANLNSKLENDLGTDVHYPTEKGYYWARFKPIELVEGDNTLDIYYAPAEFDRDGDKEIDPWAYLVTNAENYGSISSYASPTNWRISYDADNDGLPNWFEEISHGDGWGNFGFGDPFTDEMVEFRNCVDGNSPSNQGDQNLCNNLQDPLKDDANNDYYNGGENIKKAFDINLENGVFDSELVNLMIYGNNEYYGIDDIFLYTSVDSPTNEDYPVFVSMFRKNFDEIGFEQKTIPDEYINSYAPASGMTYSSTCPKDTCWSGAKCVPPGSLIDDNLDVSPLTEGSVCLGNSQDYDYVCVEEDDGADWKPINDAGSTSWDGKCSNICPEDTCFLEGAFYTDKDFDFDLVNDADDNCIDSSLAGADARLIIQSGINNGCYDANSDNTIETGEDSKKSWIKYTMSGNNGEYHCVPNLFYYKYDSSVKSSNNYGNPIASANNVQALCVNGKWSTKLALMASYLEKYAKDHGGDSNPLSEYTIFCSKAEDFGNNGEYPICMLRYEDDNGNDIRVIGISYDNFPQSFYNDFSPGEKREIKNALYDNNNFKFPSSLHENNREHWEEVDVDELHNDNPDDYKIKIDINPNLKMAFITRYKANDIFDDLVGIISGISGGEDFLTSLKNFILNPIETLKDMFNYGVNEFAVSGSANSNVIENLPNDRIIYYYHSVNSNNKEIMAYEVPEYGSKGKYFTVSYKNLNTEVLPYLRKINNYASLSNVFITPIKVCSNDENKYCATDGDCGSGNTCDIIGRAITFYDDIADELKDDLTSSLRLSGKDALTQLPYYELVHNSGDFIETAENNFEFKIFNSDGENIVQRCEWEDGTNQFPNCNDGFETNCCTPVEENSCNVICKFGDDSNGQDSTVTIKVTGYYNDGKETDKKTYTFTDLKNIITNLRITPVNPLPSSTLTAHFDAKYDGINGNIVWYKENEGDEDEVLYTSNNIDTKTFNLNGVVAYDNVYFKLTNLEYNQIKLPDETSSSVTVQPFEFECENVNDGNCPPGKVEVLAYNVNEGLYPDGNNKRCCSVMDNGYQKLELNFVDGCSDYDYKLLNGNEWQCYKLGLGDIQNYKISCAEKDFCSSDEVCITSVNSDKESLGPCKNKDDLLNGEYNVCCRIAEE